MTHSLLCGSSTWFSSYLNLFLQTNYRHLKQQKRPFFPDNYIVDDGHVIIYAWFFWFFWFFWLTSYCLDQRVGLTLEDMFLDERERERST